MDCRQEAAIARNPKTPEQARRKATTATRPSPEPRKPGKAAPALKQPTRVAPPKPKTAAAAKPTRSAAPKADARPARATAAAKPTRSAAPKSDARPARASAAAKPTRSAAAKPARSAPAIRQLAASKASASKAAAAQARPPARKGATVNPAAGKPVAKPAKPAKAAEKPAATRKPRKMPQRAKLDPNQIELLVKATVASLEDDKAEDVVVLDIASRSAFADRMVVATGLADRQIQAMAAHLDKVLGEHGIRRIRTETSPDWVLLDAGDLIVHLFKPEARANYRLEKMWGPDSPPPGEDDTLADDTPLPSLTAADYADDEEEDLDGDALDGGMDEGDDEDAEGRG